MKKFSILMLASAPLALANAFPMATPQRMTSLMPTVLETREHPNGHTEMMVRDAKGRVFKQTLRPDAPAKAPVKKAPSREYRERTFYEGFEGYNLDLGLNWIPDGWSKICTEAHTPTDLGLSHNVNNTWYVYYSSDFFQEMTPDGESEAFIHFGYNGEYGANDSAQDEWLVSPSITVGENEDLSFLLQCDYSTVHPWDWDTMTFVDRSVVDCTLKVMLSEDDGENWKCIWDLEEDAVRDVPDSDCYYKYGDLMYHDFSTSLADYAGKTVKLAFRYVRGSGWVGNSMMLDRVVIDHAAEAPEWTLLGTGTMADAWVIPQLTINPGELYNPADYVFDVEIYESTVTPGVFKLASPYTSEAFPFLYLNGNTDIPYDIVIDASNPEFVTVAPQISGFEHNNPGSKAARYAAPYYISNAATYFLEDGNAMEAIINYGYASTYDATAGVITINFPQYGHMTDNGLDMGYDCCGNAGYSTVITLPESGSSDPTWESCGTGYFCDAFVYAGYFGDPTGHEWEVEFEQNTANPALYRMVNPYTTSGSPLVEFNDNTNPAYVVIDTTYPELVVIMPQYSGFTTWMNNQVWNMYIGNIAGFYITQGNDMDTLLAYMNQNDRDKMEDLVVTIKTPLFGSNNSTDFGYQWVDTNEVPLPYEAKIYLPGSAAPGNNPDTSVSEIETAAEGEAQFFTPTGIRLGSEPVKGLYIKVENGKAVKIMK